MHNYDRAYKRLFAHPEMVIHLLRLIPEKWVEELEWGTLQRVNTVLVASLPLERRTDMVWRIRCRGQRHYLYLILEFQTRPDRHMPVRMLAYVVLLYQELIREGLLPLGEQYSPVLPAVVYTGQRPWKVFQEIRKLIENRSTEIEKYLPCHRFLMLDAVRFSSRRGRIPDNLVSALFCLEACRSPSQMLEELKHLNHLLEKPGREELNRSFADWLYQAYLPSRLGKRFPEFEEFDIEKVSKMIELREDAWCLQWKKEGLQEGRREGRREGHREGQRFLLQRQLEHKFGKIGKVYGGRLESASAKQLLDWADRLLAAESLEQVFGE